MSTDSPPAGAVHLSEATGSGHTHPERVEQAVIDGGVVIAVCVKWAALHVDVDPIRGTVTSGSHNSGFSDADRAAVETALRIADAWTATGAASSVEAVCVGPEAADQGLRELLACGVVEVIRVDAASGGGSAGQLASGSVAALLADVVADIGAQLVVCGDVSVDRGSGSVPAFLAHRLGAAQALGLIEVKPGDTGRVAATRRLDGARRELLSVESPAVISVEGAVADLRRATLPATIAARMEPVDIRPASGPVEFDTPTTSPWRPRTRVVPAPESPDALDRIAELTGARNERQPALTLHLEPADAARAIVDQLTKWGYLEEHGGAAGGDDADTTASAATATDWAGGS